MSLDSEAQIQRWMAAGKFGKVSDAQAQSWLATDETLWAVAVSPRVRVQTARQLQ